MSPSRNSSGGSSSRRTRPAGRSSPPPARRPPPAAAPPPGENNPEGRHDDERKLLTTLHNKAPGKPCFWKHDKYGTSSDTCIKIPPAEYDTHPCHYRANGIRQAEGAPEVYNTRHITGVKPAKARTDNQEVAIRLGYLKTDGRTGELTPSKKSHEYAKGAPAVAKQKNASERGKGTRFLTAYRARYGNSLSWLASDPQAWDVNYRMVLEAKDFKSVFGGTRDNKPKNYVKLLKKLSMAFDSKTFLGPLNFHFDKTHVPDGEGFGKWYPYEHDHHHMIPASAFQEYVLNGKPADAVCHYMSRARIVMQGSWNLHNEINMILLPNEVYPARILDLAAHIPWHMGADHKTYTRDLETKLTPIMQILDKALRKAQTVPRKERHIVEKRGAAKFSKEMKEVCEEQRQELLDKGFHILEPH